MFVGTALTDQRRYLIDAASKSLLTCWKHRRATSNSGRAFFIAAPIGRSDCSIFPRVCAPGSTCRPALRTRSMSTTSSTIPFRLPFRNADHMPRSKLTRKQAPHMSFVFQRSTTSGRWSILCWSEGRYRAALRKVSAACWNTPYHCHGQLVTGSFMTPMPRAHDVPMMMSPVTPCQPKAIRLRTKGCRRSRHIGWPTFCG